MARAPDSFIPTVAPESAPANDYLRVDASPGAFGAGVGGALARTGQEVVGAARDVADIEINRQQRFNQLATDDSFTNFQNAVRVQTYGDPADPTKKGYYQMLGREALDTYQDRAKSIEATRMQIRGGLQNDAQRVQFDQMSRRYTTQTLEGMGRHADQQYKTWDATVQKSVELTQIKVGSDNYNDGKIFNDTLIQGRGGVVRRLQALYGDNVDPPVVAPELTRFTSEMVKGRIERWATTSPSDALAWLKDGTVPEVVGRGPDGQLIFKQVPVSQAVNPQVYAALVQRVEPKANAAAGDAIADEIWGAGTAGARPGARTAAPLPASYADSIIQRESGNRPNETDPGSSAAGYGGFIKGTWLQFARANPEDFRGKSEAGILAMRSNRALNVKAVNWYAAQNAPVLEAAGIEPSPDNLAVAHIGPGNAIKLLKADPNAKVSSLLSGDVLAANPTWGSKTASDLVRELSIGEGRSGRRSYRAPGSDTGNENAPDFSGMVQRVLDRHLPPDVEKATISRLASRHSVWEMQTATTRNEIAKQFADAKLALEAGKDDIEIPAAQIRAVFPHAKAEDMIEELQVSRDAGQIFKGVQWGSPTEIAAARADLASGTGYTASMLRLRHGQATGGEAGTGEGETPSQFGLRQRLLGKFDQMVLARQDALGKDPAAYVASSPTVQAAVTAIDPKDPASLQAALAASLTAQEQLGVPEYKRRILSNEQVAHDVATITSIDPAKGDIGMQLDQLAKNYGDLWPKAFGEMVHTGKLPPEYQVLATMTEPGQVSARQDMQRALQMVAEHGGLEKMKKAAPEAVVQQIDKDIGVALNAFWQTTRWNAGGESLFVNVQSAAKMLAYRYAFQGQGAGEAIQHAVTGILDAKYDFDGTMRVPKGMLPQVQAATDSVQFALKPEDMAPTPGNPNLTQDERQAEVVTAVRRGSWVPNHDDTGLVLMLPLSSGMRPARGKDGSPIEVKFAALPAVTPRGYDPNPRVRPGPWDPNP